MGFEISLILFLFGISIGSFLNVCIYRIPRKISVVSPPSSCMACGENIKYRDNIPLLSYLLLRGKCRHCGASYSVRYLLVEFVTGLFFAVAWLKFGYSAELIGALFLSAIMIPVIFIDIEFQIIPDKVNIAGVVLGLLYIGISLGVFGNTDSLWGIAAGLGASLFLWLSALLGKALFKKPSMGGGDLKFALVMGLFLGFPNILSGMFIAFLYAGFLGSALIVILKNNLSGKIPFGPYLAGGTITAFYYGNEIIDIYLRYVGLK